jgi:phosphate transport system protein
LPPRSTRPPRVAQRRPATRREVISADEQVDALQRGLDARALDLLARQQPVAGDLRTIVTSLRMSADLERMGDLARHVAKVARLRYPESAIPAELHETITEMGRIGVELAVKAGEIIDGQDVEPRAPWTRTTTRSTGCTAPCSVLAAGGTGYPVETAIDVTLIGRYYERFADHAVSVARRLIFLVTGEY